MKYLLWVIICFLVSISFATTPHIITIDGSDDFVGDEVMDIVSGVEFRITWDADSFYFSVKGPVPPLDFASVDWWVFIDKNQTDGLGATDTPSPSIITFDMTAGTVYEPENAILIDDPSTATFYEWTGSWSGGVSLASVGGDHAIDAGPPGYAEFSLPFSALVPSTPHDGFCISSTIEAPGGIPSPIISAYPIENPAGAGGSILPDINWFYQFYIPHIPGPMPYGPYSPASADHSLPVSLSSFTAVGGNGQVTLKWITESEIDNDAFLLERGNTSDDFQLLAEIPGHGNSNQRHVYQFLDEHVINGKKYYYRLADRDFNGGITYHSVVTAMPFADEHIELVDGVIPYNFNLKQNYPNPFNPGTNIEFELPATHIGHHQISLNIFDIQGQRVNTLINSSFQPGHYKAFWDGRNEQGETVSSGIYIYELRTENLRLTRKLMFMK